MPAALEVRGLDVFYGRVQALHAVSLDVSRGELVTLVGPNGAGKSTLLRAVMGMVPVRAGAVVFEGALITGRPTEAIVKLGLAMVPEGRELFGPLSVRDNLALGAYARGRAGRRQTMAADLERVLALFPALASRLRQPVVTLSGGEQQMVALGRALMARPRCLVLDEPSVGLAPLMVAEIFRAIETLKSEGLSMLLVEQNARAAFRIADRGWALGPGGRLGTAERAAGADRAAREAYGLELVQEEIPR
jgi:branched-chain amino acid transport system ATP-binding protein